MDHFAGLDVSVKVTSVCIVDDAGKVVREVKVSSEPEALLAVLKNPAYHFKRIGLEAGPLSQWVFSALAEAELPPRMVRSPVEICFGTRPSQAAKSRPLENASPLPIAATMALEMIGPMPGTLKYRHFLSAQEGPSQKPSLPRGGKPNRQLLD